jgi:HK97 family phage prohead protease
MNLKVGDTVTRFYGAKAAEVSADKKTVKGWMSVEEVDRYDEVMLASAFSKSVPEFLATNPIMLLNHDNHAWPIGGWDKMEVVEGKGLWGEGHFASTEEGQKAATLYAEKILRGFSVSFIVRGLRDATPDDVKKYGPRVRRLFTEVELLESSGVTIPAVPHALAAGMGGARDNVAGMADYLKALASGLKDAALTKTVEEVLARMSANLGAVVKDYEELVAALSPKPEGAEGDEDEPPADEPTESSFGAALSSAIQAAVKAGAVKADLEADLCEGAGISAEQLKDFVSGQDFPVNGDVVDSMAAILGTSTKALVDALTKDGIGAEDLGMGDTETKGISAALERMNKESDLALAGLKSFN